MNSVLIEKNNIDDNNIVTLDMKTSIHLKEIVNVKAGDSLKGTILDEGLCKLEVVSVDERVEVKVLETFDGIKTDIELIVGASRPQTMKKVLEHGSCMGVSSYQILKANLSEKSYLQSKIYDEAELTELTDLGLSQSACFYQRPTLKKSFSMNVLEINPDSQKIILSPFGDITLSESDLDLSKPITLAIGPERGWTEQEVNEFKSLGFKEVKISPSILRVEIATFSALGYLGQQML